MKQESKKKIRILIVDDTPQNLLALEAVLDDMNLDIARAVSGKEALEKLFENPDFAMILLDVKMPEMDGFETAELIRGIEKTKQIPIIFVSAIDDDKKYKFKGYDVVTVDYIFKPIDPNILESKVNFFIRYYKKNKCFKQ